MKESNSLDVRYGYHVCEPNSYDDPEYDSFFYEIMLFGLFTPNIKKQGHCKICGHVHSFGDMSHDPRENGSLMKKNK